MSRFHIVKNINKLLRITDFQIVKQPKGRCHLSEAIRINIGSGDWSSEGWINLDYPSEWYCAAQRKHKIIPYDIRNDRLPYENDSVDLIYCSHVIEHIENKYIATLFDEMYRVLKKMEGVVSVVLMQSFYIKLLKRLERENVVLTIGIGEKIGLNHRSIKGRNHVWWII